MDIVLAKEVYRDEWTRRDALTSSLGLPITVMTAAGSGVALMTKSFELADSLASACFVGAASDALVCLLATAYFLARSYHGYEYQVLPSAKQLVQYREVLKEFSVTQGEDVAIAETAYHDYLLSRYVEAADLNSHNNVSKAAYLFRASQFLILGLAALAIAVVPWSIEQQSHTPPAQVVRLANPIGVHLSRTTIRDKPKSPDTTASAASAKRSAQSPNSRRRATATPISSSNAPARPKPKQP